MVAISHKIQASDLIQFHGWKPSGAFFHRGYSTPAFFEGFVSGEKGSVEIPIASYTTDDLI